MKYWCVKARDPFSGIDDAHSWVADDGSSAQLAVCDAAGDIIKYVNRTAPVPHDLRRHFGPLAEIEAVPSAPGIYHPRIFRPSGERVVLEVPAFYSRQWSSSLQAVRNLLVVMESVFRYLEPHPKNAGAFGHELRQLLILGCTEVESSLKAVLKANHYATPPNGRFTTNDYVKLLQPMRLREWEVYLTFHPDYPPFKPFESWDPTNPTRSLSWYSAYNAVKHDREDNFQEATLENALVAVGAAYLLVTAQFGMFHNVFAELTDPFRVNQPTWPLSEYYVPPGLLAGAAWSPADFHF
jgi:hypothetical protein